MRGICVTSKALRDILERVLAGQDRIADKDVVARRLLIAMSRDLDALTKTVDALVENLPENKSTNVQAVSENERIQRAHMAEMRELSKTCNWCAAENGADGYCKDQVCRGAESQ